jgi:hypothetical protein
MTHLASCPSGWTEFGGNCYYFPSDKLTWNEARGHCHGVNPAADLAVVQNQQENNFLLGMRLEIRSSSKLLFLFFLLHNVSMIYIYYYWNRQEL